MYCGGHVGRQHRKQLEKLSQKTFSQKCLSHHKEIVHPSDAELRCTCVRMHRKGCGCMSQAFIAKAVLNHSVALVQSGTDPETFVQAITDLGSHHARDENTWGTVRSAAGMCLWTRTGNQMRQRTL